MKAPLISIPAGLESAYYGAVAELGGNNPDTIIAKRPSPAKSYFSYVANRSLFVKWKSLWASFDSSRKISWQGFWSTLPFGSHGGLHGYPGSGYSAFVYVNAPLYNQGLSLLLDPPPFPELVYNGDFNLFGAGWRVDDGIVDFSNNKAQFHPAYYSDFSTDSTHYFSIAPNVTYRIEFDVITTSGSINFTINVDGGGFEYYNKEFDLISLTHFSDDVVIQTSPYTINAVVRVFASPSSQAWIDNISIKRL